MPARLTKCCRGLLTFSSTSTQLPSINISTVSFLNNLRTASLLLKEAKSHHRSSFGRLATYATGAAAAGGRKLSGAGAARGLDKHSSWTRFESHFSRARTPGAARVFDTFLSGVRHTAAMSHANGQVASPGGEALNALRSSPLLKSQCYVNGKWVGADGGETMPVTNPATNEVIVEVPHMGYKETERAVEAAYEAQKSWRKTSMKERSSKMRKWYDLMMEHRQQLGELMTLEQGKPLAESLAEVDYGAGYVEFYAEEAKRSYGDILPAPMTDRQIMVIRQPVGVVGIITPWNFPIAMITRKAAPALAAGCTIVIKPAELTPLCCLAMAELAMQAGIPAGVLNVVIGDAKSIGNAMLESPQVSKFSFTGSTPVGKMLMAAASNTVKKVALELGGNAPFIVFDDANLELAVKGAVSCKFRNSGQTCICANRFLVQDGIYDKFASAFVEAVKAMKVGDGMEEGVKQGPLINEKGVQKVQRMVDDAVSKGAKVLTGGKAHSLGGLFWEPTVLGDTTAEMSIHSEEVFGPVAPLFRFKTEEDAIQMANDTEFGLAAYLYTENIARGWRVMEAIESGMVGFNEAAISSEYAPFGGVKQSGHGREGSKYGLQEYTNMKYVLLGNLK